MNKILEVKNLSKVFEKRGRKVHALAKINFDVNKGEYISIQGPSGSGKTTLLNVLGCLDKPSSGKLIIDGTKVSEMNGNSLSKIRAKKIGFIFQEFNLIPILSAIENVELPMELTNIPKTKRRSKAEKLLKLVDLVHRKDHLPGELSAGEQQRVAVARALANDPAIILADEPTGNLDSKTSKKIMKLLDKLNKDLGTTIIVVTHDDKMARLTKKLVFIKDGKIIGREIAITRNFDKIEEKFDLVISGEERIMILEKDEETLVHTNGKILETDHNTIIYWPKDQKEISWKIKTDVNTSRSFEKNRPIMIEMLKEHWAKKKIHKKSS